MLEVKRFVKGEGGADIYPSLEVNFIKGHNPDFVLFDDNTGEELERHALNRLSSDEIHELIQSKGIAKGEVEVCDNPDGC